jgi:hypothetical protein
MHPLAGQCEDRIGQCWRDSRNRRPAAAGPSLGIGEQFDLDLGTSGDMAISCVVVGNLASRLTLNSVFAT